MEDGIRRRHVHEDHKGWYKGMSSGLIEMDDIEFRLNVDKEKYLLGEPFIVYPTLSNITIKPVSLINQLDPEIEIVTFYIMRGRQETLFVPYLLADSILQTQVLKPNESLRKGVKIFYGAGDWTFNSAGNYQIRATFNGLADDPKEKIQSNPVVVQIRPPENEQEKEQVNLLMGDEQGLFLLFEGGDHLSNGIQKLTELGSKYPTSELSGYANFALGMSYSRDFKDFSKGKVRPIDTKKSISFLKKAKGKDLGRYYTRQIYFTLAKMYGDSHLMNDRKAILEEFVKRFSRDTNYMDIINEARDILNTSG